MKGIKSSKVAVAIVVVLVLAGASLASTPYGVGFTWSRWDDWKPGTTNGSSTGNPCKDAAGNPVWSYEYTLNIPLGADLDTSDGIAPWYTLPTNGLMVWDNHVGPAGVWSYKYDDSPGVFPGPNGLRHAPQNQSYRGDHFHKAPVVRWDNPTSERITVSVTSGSGFLGVIHRLPTGWTADAVIARTDASAGTVELLYSQTFTKTLTESETQLFALDPVNIQNLVLDPGDDILFSVRSRTPDTGYVWKTVGLEDDIDITVVPEPATMGLLSLGGLAAMRRRRAG